MRRRVIFMVLAAVFVASQLSYAGVINSYVTNLGNAENMFVHDAGYGNWWNGFDRTANNAAYTYGCCPNWSTTTYTWLQMALPSFTGSITEATLFVNVTGSSSGDSARLYHTTNSSSATGDANQNLPGDVLVQTINN